MSERYIGRFAVTDTMRRLPTPPRDSALTLKHIGTLHGSHMSAERSEDGDLRLYSAVDDFGQPAQREMAVEGSSGIRSSAHSRLDHGYVSDQSPAELNALYAKSHAVGLRPRR
jgi:hypothetical protein